MSIKLFVAAWIAVFLMGLKIIEAVREHAHAKDVLKALEEVTRSIEEKRREAEARKSAADAERRAAESKRLYEETKATLADKIAAMNEEQLAAYNRTFDEAIRKAYTPPPVYVPVWVPSYGLQPQSMMTQPAWRW